MFIQSIGFSIITPLAFGTVFLLYDSFDFNYYYCRINPEPEYKIFIMISTSYALFQITLNLIFSFVLYFKGIFNQSEKLYINTILGYSLTFLVCWIPLTVTRFWNSMMKDHTEETKPYQILFYFSFHIYLLQGLIYFLILTMQSEFRQSLKDHLKYDGLFGCWRMYKKDTQDGNDYKIKFTTKNSNNTSNYDVSALNINA